MNGEVVHLVAVSIDGQHDILNGALAAIVRELYHERHAVGAIVTGKVTAHFTLSRGEPVVQLEFSRMGRKIRRENGETSSTALNSVVDEAA